MSNALMIADLEELYTKSGFKFRKTLNVFGFRDDSNQEDDVWNDYIGVCFPKEEKIFLFSGTTDPASYYTQNPYKGTAGAMHLCLGQYLQTYQTGNHHDRAALVQWNAPVRIWRDVDKNYRFDSNIDKVENFSWNGTNIHYPSKNEEAKLKYSSAGCQVIKPDEDDYFKQWEYFYTLVTDAMKQYEERYIDYTLFDIKVMPDSIAENIDLILDKG